MAQGKFVLAAFCAVMLGEQVHGQALPPATYLSGSNATAQFPFAGYCNPPAQHNSGGVVPTPYSRSATSSGNCDVASASAFASAFSQPGRVGSYVSVGVAGATQCSYGPCQFIALGAADARANLAEFFNVKSTSLAYATPVSLLFSTVLHAPVKPNSLYPTGTSLRLVSAMSSAAWYLDYDPNNPVDMAQSFVLQTFVGARFSLDLDLYTALNVQANPTQADFSFVDATASAYLDALTDGVDIESSSGYDYSTPDTTTTPEPAGLVLLATGLSAFVLFVRRKRAAPSSI